MEAWRLMLEEWGMRSHEERNQAIIEAETLGGVLWQTRRPKAREEIGDVELFLMEVVAWTVGNQIIDAAELPRWEWVLRAKSADPRVAAFGQGWREIDPNS